MTAQVVRLPRKEWRHAGAVEGRAFADTPLFVALFPDTRHVPSPVWS